MDSPTRQIPVVEGVFTWPSDDPRLIGSNCRTCGEHFFPKVKSCQNPDCPDKSGVEDVLLSKTGKLWSYTIQHYAPPLPYRGPVPLIIGLVGLPENQKVMGQLTGCREEELKIGMAMELVIEKLFVDEEGREVLTWKFKPVQANKP